MAANVHNFSGAIKVGSLASDPASPVNGLIYYNTSSGKLRKYEGGAWTDLAASAEVNDSTFRIVDNGDATKKIAFEASGITTGTVRTITMPDASVNLGHIANLQTLSGVSAGAVDLGSFTGAIISDNDTIKGALQELETAIESLPDPMEYKGNYNATTNSPSLADGGGNNGDVYYVSVAGTQDFGSGNITFAVSDRVVYSGADSKWQKWDTTDQVLSVNGQMGAVSLTTSDIAQGTNLYFTAAAAKAAAVADAIVNGVTDVAPSQNAVFDALAGKSDVGHTHVAADITDFSSAAQAATISQVITNGVTTKAPSEDAVFDALALKANDSIVVKTVNGVSPTAGAVVLTTSDIAQGTNLYFTAAAAKAAAVADSITNGVTDVAPSQNAVFDALALKLANVVEDTTPQLGGDLDLNAKVVLGTFKRAALASASNFIEEEYVHAATLDESTTAVAAAFTFDATMFEGCEITYKIKEASSNAVRIGSIRIAADGTNTSFTDQYTETADIGVSWSVAMNSDNVELSYTTTANDKTMRADIKRFKA